MSEKVLGLREQDFIDAIAELKKAESEDDGSVTVLRKEVIAGVREMLEIMLKEKVPVVSLEEHNKKMAIVIKENNKLSRKLAKVEKEYMNNLKAEFGED